MMTKKLGFGFMRLPLADKNDQSNVDSGQVNKMVDLFMARGFTYFDTAYMYHNYKSETILRESLVKRFPRDSFTVATKMPTMFLKGTEYHERLFNEQLEKSGVDYFDYYLLHALNSKNYVTAQQLGTFGYVARKKTEGKIRKTGFSYHDNPELLDRILTEHPEVDFVQLQINYLDWENQGIQSRHCYETAVKHGKPVAVMEPVKGGMLAELPGKATALLKSVHPDWSTASWAIRFAASCKGVMMVLSGMSSVGQLDENTSSMENFVPLTQEELTVLWKAVDIINESTAIPCTACRYCVEGCPEKIPIPAYFALYNTEKRSESSGFSTQQLYYNNYILSNGKASDCIGCGHCETCCPQHLPVTRYLKDVTAIFEKNA